jgi:hypothetical protein
LGTVWSGSTTIIAARTNLVGAGEENKRLGVRASADLIEICPLV